MGCIHRLDGPVSGVILFAKTSKALDRMNKLFKQRTIQKTYWAVVKNSPPHAEGQLAHWLVKNPETNIVTPYEKEVPGSLFSELSYRVLQKTEHWLRSEEHTSELQSLMRISYAVFCLKKKTQTNKRKK